ncbi:hypothetical protein BC834DRAFT_1043242 [Gloeopeniophorella convolvens]|nr:hypothetical protein BC834DRAFT_1043242 [Gloeopeniophorella convolvens]
MSSTCHSESTPAMSTRSRGKKNTVKPESDDADVPSSLLDSWRGPSVADEDPVNDGALPSLSSMALTEESISAAIMRVSTLKSHRNSFLPISKLPTELLSRVFHLHAIQQPHGEKDDRLGWIVASHVCRRWRQVVLRDAKLWRGIYFRMGSKWVAEMISRAGVTLLDVELEGARTPDDWNTIFNHLHHTRSVSAQDLSLGSLRYVIRLLSMAAPTLNALDLQFLPNLKAPIDFREVQTGTKVFGGRAPNLSEITLGRLVHPWDFLPRGSLTFLHLIYQKRDLRKGASNAVSWDNLMSIISDNTNIRSLALEFCLPPSSPTWSLQHQAIELPRLECLSLGGQGISVYSLLASIKYPPSARLRIHSLSTQPTGADLYFIMPLLAAHVGAPGSEPLRSAWLYVPDTSAKTLEIWTREALPKISFDDSFFNNCDLRTVLREVFFMLPLANLEFLRIDAPNVFDTEDWTTMLRRCTLVNDIEIKGHGFSSIAEALLRPAKSPSTTVTAPVSALAMTPTGTVDPPSVTKPALKFLLFPGLTCLSVSNVDLTRKTAKNVPGHDLLEKLATRRMRSDKPLSYVNIFRCKFGPTRAQKLAKIRRAEIELDEDDSEPEDITVI